MKAVVTGATSMMGCSLIRSLIDNGTDRIFAVVHPDSHNLAKISYDKRIAFIECDCQEHDHLPELINEECDVFYHFAWIPSHLVGRERYFDLGVAYENIGQTLKAFESAVQLGCSNFVGAGSQAEYGNRRCDVQRPTDPSDPVTAYAIAKDACRRMCMLKANNHEMNVQWVRIFSVYGPHDRKNTLISTILPKLSKGEDVDLTSCEQIWEYLYEDDAGEGLYYAGLTPPEMGSNIYCLGSGDAKPLKQFIEEMIEITQSQSKINFGAVPFSKDMVLNLHSDITSLKEKTGWKGPAVSFEDGIKKCMDSWNI